MSNQYIAGTFRDEFGTELGGKLWSFLNEAESIACMKTASKLGRPAIEGIEELLLIRFEQDITMLKTDRCKQMIGHMIRQVMEVQGYVIAQQNVKLISALFLRATRYTEAGSFIYHAYRSDDQMIALTRDKTGSLLPGDKKWTYRKSFQSGICARIGFGLKDEKLAISEIQRNGYYVFYPAK